MTNTGHKKSGGRNVTVFEAINRTRKEFFVGTTARKMHEIIAQFSDSLPPEIAHWKTNDKIDYQSIEFNLPAKDAKQFGAACARSLARSSDWKVIRQRS